MLASNVTTFQTRFVRYTLLIGSILEPQFKGFLIGRSTALVVSRDNRLQVTGLGGVFVLQIVCVVANSGKALSYFKPDTYAGMPSSRVPSDPDIEHVQMYYLTEGDSIRVMSTQGLSQRYVSFFILYK